MKLARARERRQRWSMRALLCPAGLAALAVLAACGPKVPPQPPMFDEDLPSHRIEPAPEATAAPEPPPRPEAAPGKGLRTGTIERARLISVLDSGPGSFLRQIEVTPRMDGQRFVGWELVQVLDRKGPLADVDLVPGDVLLAVNGRPLARPDQLQSLWDSLRTADELTADLWRGEAKLELHFQIEPKSVPAPAVSTAPAAAAP